MSQNLEALREAMPDVARDTRINLQSVLVPGTLSKEQVWGTAVASAAAARRADLLEAMVAQARIEAGDAVVDDGLAAAAMMAMNNVFYRFRHLVEKPSYADKPARLRMQRLGRPATNKVDFELFCLAVSAINNCEACVKAHEDAVLKGGLTEDHVQDAVRIAAVVQSAAVALEIAAAAKPAS